MMLSKSCIQTRCESSNKMSDTPKRKSAAQSTASVGRCGRLPKPCRTDHSRSTSADCGSSKQNCGSSDCEKALSSDKTKKTAHFAKPVGCTASCSSAVTKRPDVNKLKAVVREFGEYPAKYRVFVWRCLLELPENHFAYAALIEKGIHPSCTTLQLRYPVQDAKLFRILQRLLSALAHWSPVLGECEYLPLLVFPFAKLFQNNQLIAFEIVASLITNWCGSWFEYFPNPPLNVLGVVENLLAYHDATLYSHFVRNRITTQSYCWPLLFTLFSEVLTKPEWLAAIDNLLSNPPGFVLCVSAAFCIASRAPLLQLTEREDVEYYFRHRNSVSVRTIMREAYRIQANTPRELHPCVLLDDFKPLTREQYPAFTRYPKQIVEHHIAEHERLRQEELALLKQQEESLKLYRETERHAAEQATWYREQELLAQAEQERRRLLDEEEAKLSVHKARISQVCRDLKLRELQLLEEIRRKHLVFANERKAVEIAQLDREIQRKSKMKERTTLAAIAEAEFRNYELKLRKQILDQEVLLTTVREKVTRANGDSATPRARTTDNAETNLADFVRSTRELETNSQSLIQDIQQRLSRFAAEREKPLSATSYEFLLHPPATSSTSLLPTASDVRNPHAIGSLANELAVHQLNHLLNENGALEERIRMGLQSLGEARQRLRQSTAESHGKDNNDTFYTFTPARDADRPNADAESADEELLNGDDWKRFNDRYASAGRRRDSDQRAHAQDTKRVEAPNATDAKVGISEANRSLLKMDFEMDKMFETVRELQATVLGAPGTSRESQTSRRPSARAHDSAGAGDHGTNTDNRVPPLVLDGVNALEDEGIALDTNRTAKSTTARSRADSHATYTCGAAQTSPTVSSTNSLQSEGIDVGGHRAVVPNVNSNVQAPTTDTTALAGSNRRASVSSTATSVTDRRERITLDANESKLLEEIRATRRRLTAAARAAMKPSGFDLSTN